MMAFLLFAPASAKWLGWRKDRASPRDRLGRFCNIYCAVILRACLHGVGDSGLVGLVSLFLRSGGHKTKETYPTRPGSPTPCKQDLRHSFALRGISDILWSSSLLHSRF